MDESYGVVIDNFDCKGQMDALNVNLSDVNECDASKIKKSTFVGCLIIKIILFTTLRVS